MEASGLAGALAGYGASGADASGLDSAESDELIAPHGSLMLQGSVASAVATTGAISRADEGSHSECFGGSDGCDGSDGFARLDHPDGPRCVRNWRLTVCFRVG